MMTVVVDEEAEGELLAAAEWYERERVGLGWELLVEASRVLGSIGEAPATWPVVDPSSSVRRFVFARFPYIAYFVIRSDDVLVLAFGHTKRRPGYWQHRRGP